MAEHRIDTWQPSPELELMLHAAIDVGEPAREAWERWIACGGNQKTDDGSQRFYPLLYRNLQKLGIDHPELQRFGLSYRNVWARNQLVMRHLEEVLGDFEQHGIPTLVMKGAALLGRYYKDIGTRSMADFDVLVPLAQTDEAMARLVEKGWNCAKPLSLMTAEYRAPHSGMGFAHDKKNAGCDLHWHVLHLHLNEIYDAPMWAASVPLQIGHVQSRALGAEHQLIHLLSIGCLNEENTNKRWLPDTLMVLKNEPTLDWEFVVKECQRLQFVQPAAAMLAYLRSEWKVAVPVTAIETLAQTPVSYRVRRAYECFNLPKAERSGLLIFWLLYTQYALSQPQARSFAPLDFIRFASHRWSLDGRLGSTLTYTYLRIRGVSGPKAREMLYD